MNIHTLNTSSDEKPTAKLFENLPNESAVELIVMNLDIAKNNNQTFTLENFNRIKHQRGLCVGLTEGDDLEIALFYISDFGLYAWDYTAHIHVVTEMPSSNWITPPLQIGTTYWFGPSNQGSEHAKALAMGTETDIKRRYKSLHPRTAPAPQPAIKRQTANSEDDGASPVLHPQRDFELLTSLDDFGL